MNTTTFDKKVQAVLLVFKELQIENAFFVSLKIAGRKRPALVDPLHKVCQGGKGSVWDGQTYGWTDGHFQFTSGPLPVHFQSIWAP